MPGRRATRTDAGTALMPVDASSAVPVSVGANLRRTDLHNKLKLTHLDSILSVWELINYFCLLQFSHFFLY